MVSRHGVVRPPTCRRPHGGDAGADGVVCSRRHSASRCRRGLGTQDRPCSLPALDRMRHRVKGAASPLVCQRPPQPNLAPACEVDGVVPRHAPSPGTQELIRFHSVSSLLAADASPPRRLFSCPEAAGRHAGGPLPRCCPRPAPWASSALSYPLPREGDSCRTYAYAPRQLMIAPWRNASGSCSAMTCPNSAASCPARTEPSGAIGCTRRSAVPTGRPICSRAMSDR